MKAVIASLLLAFAATSANAATWWVGSVLYGNVCRAGGWYTVYPTHMGQPVGTSCPVRDGNGVIIGYGFVSAE